ncbi:Orexin receptor type 2 [Folsomia candida]|uniref:Orexin receptor type 2 n=1 Tax=Folsomia candida TaxID=158441 RepID=A0A226EYG4_FOLCA|nr:Orexin receptor type 2 [Folsomia candida]
MLATAPHPQNAHSALSPAEVIAAAANALIEISCSPAPSSLKIGQTVSISVSVLTLTVISVERWYAICFPLRFKATTARAKRLVLIIWVISLIIDIPELVVLQTSRREDVPVDTIYFMQCKPTWESQWDIALTILKMLLLYAIPLTFMSFAYYQIVKVLWSSANIPGNSTTSTVTSSGRRQTVVVNSNGSSHHNGQCQAQCKNQIHLLPQYYLRTYY